MISEHSNTSEDGVAYVEGQDYLLDDDGPYIMDDHEYQSDSHDSGTPIMSRTTIETRYSNFGDEDWADLDAEDQAWWIDWIVRYHAVEVALLDYPDQYCEFVRDVEYISELNDKLPEMEDRLENLPPSYEAWKDQPSVDWDQGQTEGDRPFGYIDGWFIAWELNPDGELAFTLDRDPEDRLPDDLRLSEYDATKLVESEIADANEATLDSLIIQLQRAAKTRLT